MTSLIQTASAGPRKPALRQRLRASVRRLWGSEDGSASLEFVLVVPVLLFIFMAAFEAGMLMTRYIMLEQSLDMTMRNLRLGQYPNPTAALIKTEICSRTVILAGCESAIKVELQPVSTTTWAFPSNDTGCVDRSQAIDPAVTFNPGAPHQIMLVRVCVAQDTLFATTGIGLGLPKDGNGAYGLVATSAFVNEP